MRTDLRIEHATGSGFQTRRAGTAPSSRMRSPFAIDSSNIFFPSSGLVFVLVLIHDPNERELFLCHFRPANNLIDRQKKSFPSLNSCPDTSCFT
jgi:hypothetical protein